MQLQQTLLVFLKLLLSVNSYRILGLFPHPGKSHVDVFLPLMKGLANAGHEVLVVSHFPLNKPVPKYKDISLKGQVLVDVFDMLPDQSKIERWRTIFLLDDLAQMSCELGLATKEVQDLIKSNEAFDVIIAEFFNSDCFLGFVDKFKAPLIGLSSCTLMPWTNDIIGNPSHPAYIPENLLEFSDKLSFLERVENTVVEGVHTLYYRYVAQKKADEISRKYFGKNMPNLRDIALNTSLILVNSHFSLNLPRPLVPAVIEMGGIHIQELHDLPGVSVFLLII